MGSKKLQPDHHILIVLGPHRGSLPDHILPLSLPLSRSGSWNLRIPKQEKNKTVGGLQLKVEQLL